MDIAKADKMKKEMRLALWWIKRKFKKDYGVTFDEILEDLDSCGNIVIGKIWKEVKEMADEIKEGYQKDIAIEFPAFILWAVYRDTAYINPFFYVLTKIMREHERLLPIAEKYYKEPKDWYVNRWHSTKAESARLKAEGKIPDIEGAMGYDETIFTPPIQHERNQQYNKYQAEIDRLNTELEKNRKKVVKQEEVR